MNKAKREQIEKKMSTEIFSIYWILKNENIPNAENIAKSMNNIIVQFPYWRTSEEHERRVRQELYKTFTKNKIDIKRASELGIKIMDMLKRSER